MSSPALRNFSAGELSPTMYARADLVRYQEGLETLRNAIVLRTGGVQSRPGTQYLGTTKDNGFARLIDAVFDDDQSYVLELGIEYIRFWKDGALVEGVVLEAWTNGNVYDAGEVVSLSGTNYVALQTHTAATATNRPTSGTNWTEFWYPLTALIYELPTPWNTEAVLRAVQYASEKGVVRFAHNGFARQTLTRTANAQWDIAEVTGSISALAAPTNVLTDGPLGTQTEWIVTAVDASTGRESVGSTETGTTEFLADIQATPQSISWTASTGATAYRVYRKDENTAGIFGLLAEVSASPYVDSASVFLPADTGTQPPTAGQDFTNADTFPGVIGAYQQRTLLSGSTGSPDVVLASRVASPDDFTVSTPLVDSDSLSWRQVGKRTNRVRHFAEIAQRLVQFSSVGESIIQGDTDSILRPGEVNPRQFSENGAAVYPAPLVVNDSALYVQALGSIVRDIAPIQANGFAGSDLTLQSAHLVDGFTLMDWCYQQTPNSVVWAVRSDGTLLSLTYVRELGVLGWATHDTDGTFESVTCIPEGGRDAVYAVVLREVDGNDVRYVERFADRQVNGANYIQTYADASVDVTATGTTITGLDHLEAKDVSVLLINGSTGYDVIASPNNPAYTAITVSGGEITVPASATNGRCIVGLPYVTDIQTLDLDGANSSRMDSGINIKRVGLWLEDAVAPFVANQVPSGDDVSTMNRMPNTTAGEAIATGLVSGYCEVTVDGAFTRGGRIFIRQVDPVPLSVLAIIPQGTFGRS
jgi:hypothetical protein